LLSLYSPDYGLMEGLIGRPTSELTDTFGNRMIVKVKHSDLPKEE